MNVDRFHSRLTAGSGARRSVSLDAGGRQGVICRLQLPGNDLENRGEANYAKPQAPGGGPGAERTHKPFNPARHFDNQLLV